MELERNAAYIEAKRALESIGRAKWPPEVARPAEQFATATVDAITQSFGYGPATAARRRYLRGALLSALELTTICDIARAQGLVTDDSILSATRMLSLLSMAYQATCVRDD